MAAKTPANRKGESKIRPKGRNDESKTRSVDEKGRVTLPFGFANTTVEIVDVDEFEIRIRKVVTIPAREAWLYKNPDALGTVLAGLHEAKAGEFAQGPDVAADLAAIRPDDEDED